MVYGFIKVMRKTKTFAKLLAPFLLAAFVAIPLMHFKQAQAQSLTANVNFVWVDGTSSCYATANGQTQAYFAAVKGDSVTIHVANTSSTASLDIHIDISGHTNYSTTLVPSGSVNKIYTANSLIEVFADGSAGSPCTSGRGGPGYFAVEPAAGSVSCKITDNQVWNVSVNYSNVFGNASLYRGSTFVAPFNGIKNGQLVESEQFSAMATAATYNLYYGSNNSARLLGHATCPAKSATSSGTSGSTSKPGTTTSKPTTKTTPATATGQSALSQADATSTTPPSSARQTPSKKKSSTWQWLAIPVVVIPLAFGAWKFYPKLRKPRILP